MLADIKLGMEYNPFISIIIPCYNQSSYLDECVSSVINQSFSNYEIIIIDDGSTDDSKIKGESWKTKSDKIRFYSINNSGVAFARNFGIEKAKGVFILPLDADDKIGEKYIEKALDHFRVKPQTKVVYCKAKCFGNKKGDWNLKYTTYSNLLIRNSIFCSGVFSKLDWERVKGYDLNMVHGLEDWEFWINLLKDSYPANDAVYQMDYAGFYYRIKDVSRNSEILNENNQTKRKSMMRYIEKKHYDTYNSVFDGFINMQRRLVDYDNLNRAHEIYSFTDLRIMLTLKIKSIIKKKILIKFNFL